MQREADSSSPKICFIDIETAPILAAVWTLHEANAIWVERDTYILSFAVKWHNEKTIKTHCVIDYPEYVTKQHCDRALLGDLWAVLDTATHVVAHNGDAFDIKKINARFAVHGLKPPSPYKTLDTLKLSRRSFKFDSNKLDNLGRYLSCGRKLQHQGANLWRKCMEGDQKAWALLRKYNAQDVRLLERVYERLKPWANIDLRPFTNAQGCPTCLSSNVQRRGIAVARSRRYQRFQCQDCGHWFPGEIIRAAPDPAPKTGS